jgi:hypothetical protein
MKDHVDPSDRAATHVWITQIAAEKLESSLEADEVRLVAGREIVDDSNTMAERDESMGEMRADEARSTRNKTP